MDLIVLKKKINTFKGEGGRLRNVNEQLLGEILQAWEQWTGPASSFYKEIGVSYRKMGKLMGKAKQLKREGYFDGLDFKEIEVETDQTEIKNLSTPSNSCGIELIWNNNVIRFGSSDLLLDFLKKAA